MLNDNTTNQKQLSREREDERILNQLRQEFSRIDISQDGSITFDEVRQFLLEQTNGKVDLGLAEQIFQELDEDGSGAILLSEFVESYFVKQRLVKERITDLDLSIKAHNKSREQLLTKLREQKLKEKVNAYGLDLDAILTVRVVEARDIMPMDINGKSDPYIVLKLGNMQMQKTNYINADLNPVWNEVFTFDVDTGKEVMEITAFDKDNFGSDDFLGRFDLTLDNYRDQQAHDEWFDLMPLKPSMAKDWHGKVRLVI